MARPVLFVIVAPSGAGKTTLIARIRRRFPDLRYSISCTTRRPRPGEEHGKDYYFMEEREFRDRIAANGFLEWKEVHGNLYGTPRGPVDRAMEEGAGMILDIDVAGALEVFERFSDAVGIFIRPPDLEVLEQRLRGRGTDSEEAIGIRLRRAAEELQETQRFTYVLVNDDLDEAESELAGIIAKERRAPGE